MKGLIKDILGTTIFVVTLSVAIIWIGCANKPRTNIFYKQQYINNHGKEIATLILGHSHAASGINPLSLGDSVFNMADRARCMHYDKEILLKDIDLLPNLRNVIYPLIYQLDLDWRIFSLTERSLLVYEYTSAFDVPSPSTVGVENPTIFKLKQFASLNNYINRIDCDSLGYCSAGENTTNKNVVLYPFDNTDSIISLLSSMANACEQHGVRFIIITPPCNTTFIRNNVDSAGLNRLNYVICKVIEQYPTVEYKNYISHCEFDNDSLFADQMHLNHLGATTLANILKKDFELTTK